MDYSSPGSGDIGALVVSGAGGAAGTLLPFVALTGETASGVVLPVGTYVFIVGSPTAPTPSQTTLTGVQLFWAAAVAATITVESTNFPKNLGGDYSGRGGIDVSDFTNTTGLWLQENASTAQVPVAGANNTVTAMTVTAGGTNAGGCMFHIGNFGARRLRIKLVTTVGGLIRCNVHGKDGGGQN